MEFLTLFDAANPGACYRRTASVRPQQALALANSDLALMQGRLLAHKLWQRSVDGTATPSAAALSSFVSRAFARCLSRSPSDEELVASLAFLERQTTLFVSVGDAALAAPKDAGAVPAATEPAARARESFTQALFSHADFVTVR